MSKYIIDTETWANLFEVQRVGVYGIGNDIVTDEKTIWSRMFSLDELEELNSDYINEHYGELQDEAYQRGINDGSLDVKQRVEGAYQKGFEDGKKSVEEGCGGCKYEWYGDTEDPCWHCRRCYKDKYEPTLHSDRIEVGDEVTFLPNDRRGIVTACHVPDVYAENDKYAVFCGTTVEYVLRQHITKTGKHYDIASILEAMRT